MRVDVGCGVRDHDLFLERHLLSAAMVFGMVAPGVNPAHFSNDGHRRIAGAIGRAREQGLTPDFPIVRRLLEESGELATVGPVVLTEIAGSIGAVKPTIESLASDALKLVDLFRQRHARGLLSRALASDEPVDPTALIQALTPLIVGPAAEPLPLTSMAELLQESDGPINWIVEGIFGAGTTNLLSGKPKAGKSTASRSAGLAIARGDDWLGRRCQQGLVWYLAFEGRRRDIKEHFLRMGARTTDPIQLFIGRAPKDVVRELERRAIKETPLAIFVDTMQRLVQATDTDSYAEMTTLLTPILAIAEQTGAAIILLHHSNKANDRDDLDSVLGSTAITGSCDTVMTLKRTERYRLIQTRQRNGDDMPSTVLEQDPHTGHVRLAGNPHDIDIAVLTRELLRVLQNADRPLDREDWLDQVDGRRQFKLEAFKALFREPEIRNVHVTGSGTRNDPRRYAFQVSDSRSPVPSKEGEPESASFFSEISSNDSARYSGSHVPAQEKPIPHRSTDDGVRY
jgi:hypothetical protein